MKIRITLVVGIQIFISSMCIFNSGMESTHHFSFYNPEKFISLPPFLMNIIFCSKLNKFFLSLIGMEMSIPTKKMFLQKRFILEILRKYIRVFKIKNVNLHKNRVFTKKIIIIIVEILHKKYNIRVSTKKKY
jgi:hypothetical protein